MKKCFTCLMLAAVMAVPIFAGNVGVPVETTPVPVVAEERFYGRAATLQTAAGDVHTHPLGQSNVYEPTAVELRVLELVNNERASAGISPMQWCGNLGASARAHSQDMAIARFFSHFCLLGISPFDRIFAAGVRYNAMAENIAAGSLTPEAAVTQWMNSDGHRRNILNSAYTHLGVGHYNLPGSPWGNYWTQKFGGGTRTVIHTTVNITVNVRGNGTVYSYNTRDSSIGTRVLLEAIPGDGDTFEGWFVGNTLVNSNSTWNLIAAASRTYEARFSEVGSIPSTPTPTATPTPWPTPPPPTPGDIDGDGTIDNDDVINLRLVISGQEQLPPGINADFNNDGTVDIIDLTALRLYLAGRDVRQTQTRQYPDTARRVPTYL